MAHELEITADGAASFAYSGKVGSAWHKLGVELPDLSDVDSILAAARADYEVFKSPLLALDPDCVHPDTLDHEYGPGIETGQFFTWRNRVEYDADGTPVASTKQVLGIVGSDYKVIQNRRAVEMGLHLISLAPDAQAIDCAGVLNDGRRFFVTIPMPDIVIDPQGVKDVHRRNLVVVTGHDATAALEIVNTVTRAVCANTVSAALAAKQHHIKIRHVGDVDTPVALAKAQLGLILSAQEEFEKAAYEMLGRDCAWGLVERMAEKMWPRPENPNERETTNHDNRIAKLEQIWNSDRGSAQFGANHWAAFNTFTEYMEHEQHIVGKDNAVNRAARALESPGFNQRVHALSKAFRSGRPLRDLAVPGARKS